MPAAKLMSWALVFFRDFGLMRDGGGLRCSALMRAARGEASVSGMTVLMVGVVGLIMWDQ